MSLYKYAALAAALLASVPALADQFSFGHPAPAAAATRTVQVTLGDMYFEPKALEVKAGETVRFVLTNKGQLAHEFTLGDAALQAAHQKEMLAMDHSSMSHDAMAGMHDDPNSVSIGPGKTAELTWAFTQATALQFACNVPGHYQAGMVGTLKVDK
ncbi:cupredoxin domain-containing protein [Pseudomonas abieticivorans]|uniref:cupredoxin domain-containing protein n=1 Tax=Pseudomonas abieticivorans TaxID=2931382 RepID=UPI0020BF1B92|nr:cupredoxin family protein [Pseudomonas sp. PIA16]